MDVQASLQRIETKLDTQAERITLVHSSVSKLDAHNEHFIKKLDKIELILSDYENRLRQAEQEISRTSVKIAVAASLIAAIFSGGLTIYVNNVESTLSAKLNRSAAESTQKLK